ncbi:bacillithiol system redox-active protein YtxJ [Frigoriflavimonas asaccharolytica]|uniref:Bacillithiol system protein YtxJ n=1 Tax=Frigoriflavimonas asaccharolytica TaxID=2735899 RepID=A0A8J8K840_9FLAO|nr:bacillithiol system redox-active protein YtxJ [Frigoriflavimonas asaccharolytica]NRS91562.1 bacillithiol system protein YtxJ [Frigoriflavimonas asaccharolytica]
MGFLNNIFNKNSEENTSTFWKNINSVEDLNNAIAESKTKKVIIFKHSTRCHISKMVLSRFEKDAENFEGDAEFYFLDLIAHRDVSNIIAENLDVTHQSPQLLILENGVVVKHASHNDASFNLVE